MSTLAVQKLSMRFGSRWLFRNLSFEIKEGQTMAITGSNGSGKSTLVRILAGVLTPTRGRVVLESNGIEVHNDHRARSVALVAPYLQLYDGLTFAENLKFVCDLRGVGSSTAEVQSLMDHVELGDRGNDLLGTFSSGMKQRARFGVALAAKSDILLLDEPSSNLDTLGVSLIRRIIKTEIDSGTTVLIATNSTEETSWCERTLSVEDFRKSNQARKEKRSA